MPIAPTPRSESRSGPEHAEARRAAPARRRTTPRAARAGREAPRPAWRAAAASRASRGSGAPRRRARAKRPRPPRTPSLCRRRSPSRRAPARAARRRLRPRKPCRSAAPSAPSVPGRRARERPRPRERARETLHEPREVELPCARREPEEAVVTATPVRPTSTVGLTPNAPQPCRSGSPRRVFRAGREPRAAPRRPSQPELVA